MEGIERAPRTGHSHDFRERVFAHAEKEYPQILRQKGVKGYQSVVPAFQFAQEPYQLGQPMSRIVEYGNLLPGLPVPLGLGRRRSVLDCVHESEGLTLAKPSKDVNARNQLPSSIAKGILNPRLYLETWVMEPYHSAGL